jgi:hypothetical protein
MREHVPAAHGEVRVRVEATESDATVQLEPWGHCVLHVGEDLLTVRIDATESAALQRLRDTVTRDLERFARGEFSVRWDLVADTTDPGAAS